MEKCKKQMFKVISFASNLRLEQDCLPHTASIKKHVTRDGCCDLVGKATAYDACIPYGSRFMSQLLHF